MPLRNVTGTVVGELRILRSLENAKRQISALQRDIVLIWIGAVVVGIALTWWLARVILEPVRALDRAAAEIGAGNYDAEVRVDSNDELGRLAKTFNGMCASIRSAREELIRQEQIATIGRLSTSIVHDLRNPLASIYGGAEMLVDDDLTPAQIKRVSSNIYRSSRRMQEMLQELVDVTRGKALAVEPCQVREVVEAALEPLRASAVSRNIEVICELPDSDEIAVERSRVERVIGNIVGNAIEAMPGGGTIRVSAVREESSMLIVVRDTGPGISPHIAARLFQPFVSAGKNNGLGLGLALSRQTVLDHGGSLWVESNPGQGAAFFVRFPM
jgi:signal transduction histidine kinase